MIRVSIMASQALDIGDFTVIEPAVEAAPPALRLVEKAPEARRAPPSWLIAPPLAAAELMNCVRENQAQYQVIVEPVSSAPYQSVREVPRAG